MRTIRPLAASLAAVAALAALVPVEAQAYPSGAWRTRNTGLTSEGQCTRRAFRAMKNANLDAQSSGNIGVLGRNDSAIVYVLCMEGGQVAAVFCSSDRDRSGNYVANLCDSVSRQMDR